MNLKDPMLHYRMRITQICVLVTLIFQYFYSFVLCSFQDNFLNFLRRKGATLQHVQLFVHHSLGYSDLYVFFPQLRVLKAGPFQ